jgi:hypothetical protein
VAYKLLLYSIVIYINIFHRIIFDARISFELKERYIIIFKFVIANIVKWGEKP